MINTTLHRSITIFNDTIHVRIERLNSDFSVMLPII
jgi:hypothetical protein